MGKSSRAHNARLAELRAEQARADRRRRLVIAGSTIAVVVLVIGGLVYAAMQNTPEQDATVASTPLDQATFANLTQVPAATFDAVGAGASDNAPKGIDAPAVTADGKPRVLYVGAEYCPYCASQRWPVVVALSRFGSWNNLDASFSAPAPEVNPDTPTVSFHGASYSSDYVSFTGIETATNKMVNGQWEKLDPLEGEEKDLFETYNAPPYVDGQGGAIPWVLYGGSAVGVGASYDSQLILGKTQAEIAAALKDANDPISQGIVGSANVLTAQICSLTGNQPGDVCSSAGVTAAAAKLG